MKSFFEWLQRPTIFATYCKGCGSATRRVWRRRRGYNPITGSYIADEFIECPEWYEDEWSWHYHKGTGNKKEMER